MMTGNISNTPGAREQSHYQVILKWHEFSFRFPHPLLFHILLKRSIWVKRTMLWYLRLEYISPKWNLKQCNFLVATSGAWHWILHPTGWGAKTEERIGCFCFFPHTFCQENVALRIFHQCRRCLNRILAKCGATFINQTLTNLSRKSCKSLHDRFLSHKPTVYHDNSM